MTAWLERLSRGCRAPVVRWLAERTCLNRARVPKGEAVAAAVAAVEAHYREHRWEAALAARQAKAYQRGHWRHQTRSLRDRADAAAGSPRGAVLRAAEESARRHFAELGRLDDPEEVIRYLARYYADDMVADFDPAFFIAYRAIARRAFPSFVQSIRVSEVCGDTLREVRKLLGSVPVFFTPNHVSNADHIPICFALNRLGAWQPLIAAGANLFRGASAVVLPKVNAYKIRREYIGEDSRWFYRVKWFHNPVYRRVHSAYLHHAWSRGEPFLFYPEGTRSRDGRLGQPKTGILEDAQRFVAESRREAHFVPVSISYAVVPEDADIEASRVGANISNQDLLQQLRELDREVRVHPGMAIHIRFGAPMVLCPGEDDLEGFAARLMGAIAAGVVRPFSSMTASALLRLGGGDEAAGPVSADAVVARVRADYGHTPEARGVELGREVRQALALLGARGIVAEGDGAGTWEVTDFALLRQYANRIAHKE